MIEIMDMVDQELVKSGKKDMLAAGIVITGGGSMIDGCIEAAERVFNMPVRVGVPGGIVGLKDVVATPQYANGVGLLKYGIRLDKYRVKSRFDKNRGGVWDRVKRWLNDYL